MPRSPVLLAIDTATSRCAVALAVAGAIDERNREVGQRHTEHLLPMVDELLAAHGVALSDCEAIAFGAGPGSFTGLRVACGAAQGLAYGIDRPVLAIGNLSAVALDAFDRRIDAATVLAAVDARMHEVYWGVFARTPVGVRELIAPTLAAPADLVEFADHHGVDALAGNALIAFADELASFAGCKLPDAEASARNIARLALVALDEGRAIEPAAAAPIYVRNRVALTVEERRADRARLAQGNA